jgi:hypothetical protein
MAIIANAISRIVLDLLRAIVGQSLVRFEWIVP